MSFIIKTPFIMKTYPLFLLLALILLGCGPANNAGEQEAEAEAVDEKESAMRYTLTPFTESQSYPEAKMTGMTFKDGVFDFEFENYELKIQTPDADAKMCANSGKGQHIHLIVDDQPYAAKYEPSFDYEIEEGEHHILAFLSRSYHESIKNGQAYLAQKTTVESNTIVEAEDIAGPMLFYSRPKGTYVGEKDTRKVMLDYFLVNITPEMGYKVKADINGEEHLLDTWQPYYIEGLPMGENTITLTLLDADGQPADVPLNPVSRTFTLKADPIEQ